MSMDDINATQQLLDDGYVIRNAQITDIDFEADTDSCSLDLWITFQTAGAVCRFHATGGVASSVFPYEFDNQHGFVQLLYEICKVAGVSKLSDLKGTYIRLGYKDCVLRAFGNIVADDWIYIYTIIEENNK